MGSTGDAEIYLSQPGLGVVLGARVLAEFGDDTTRYADARARKNYAGTSPITRQSGKKKTVLARYVHNDRLLDALNRQAFAALRASPGARTAGAVGTLPYRLRTDPPSHWFPLLPQRAQRPTPRWRSASARCPGSRPAPRRHRCARAAGCSPRW